MRCYCCDCNLTDYESTLRSTVTNQFLDMCTNCLQEAEITPISFSKSIEQEIYDDD